MLRRCAATMLRVGTGSWARTATRSSPRASDPGAAPARCRDRRTPARGVTRTPSRRARSGAGDRCRVHPGSATDDRWCPPGWRSSARPRGRAAVTRARPANRWPRARSPRPRRGARPAAVTRWPGDLGATSPQPVHDADVGLAGGHPVDRVPRLQLGEARPQLGVLLEEVTRRPGADQTPHRRGERDQRVGRRRPGRPGACRSVSRPLQLGGDPVPSSTRCRPSRVSITPRPTRSSSPTSRSGAPAASSAATPRTG